MNSSRRLAPRRSLEVALIWGLSNRINAIANGLVLSHVQRCHVKFHWVQDQHCLASFSDIFDENIDKWLLPLSYSDVEIECSRGANALVMPLTCFCSESYPLANAIRSILKHVAFDEYSAAYRALWNSLVWSEAVRKNVIDLEGKNAFHARCLRADNPYSPPSRTELSRIPPNSYIACDSHKWKSYFLENVPGAFAYASSLGGTDLSSRHRQGMIDAAVDLVTLSTARSLYIHAPIASTFVTPVVHGAKVPSIRLKWEDAAN